MNALKGEGIVDDKVWIRKSHYPLPFNGTGAFPVNKIITTARNPLDTIVSYSNLLLSLTYDKEIKEDLSVAAPEFWAGFCLQTAKQVADFYNMYITDAKKNNVLVHFLRYEDLMGDKERTLSELLAFVLDVESIEGTVVQKRIQEVVGRGEEAGIVFKVKSNLHNRHEAKFQPAHLQIMQ